MSPVGWYMEDTHGIAGAAARAPYAPESEQKKNQQVIRQDTTNMRLRPPSIVVEEVRIAMNNKSNEEEAGIHGMGLLLQCALLGRTTHTLQRCTTP